MASDNDRRTDSQLPFSYAVRELRQAKAAAELQIDHAPRKQAAPNAGFDPYNTSGSFDRKKNWARVGKR